MKNIRDYWNEIHNTKSLKALYNKIAEMPAVTGEWNIYLEDGELIVSNEYFDNTEDRYVTNCEIISHLVVPDLILEHSELDGFNDISGVIWIDKQVFNDFVACEYLNIYFIDTDNENATSYIMVDEYEDIIELQRYER